MKTPDTKGAVRMKGSFPKGVGRDSVRSRISKTPLSRQIQGQSSVKSRLSEACLVNSVTHRRRKKSRSGPCDGRVALSSVMKNQSAAEFAPSRESSAPFSKRLLSFLLRAIATPRQGRCAASAAAAIIGRPCRTRRATAVTCTSTRRTSTR